MLPRLSREVLRWTSPPALSAQVTLMAVTAVVVGLADATLVALGIAGARGAFQFVPSRLWVMAPLTWTGIWRRLSTGGHRGVRDPAGGAGGPERTVADVDQRIPSLIDRVPADAKSGAPVLALLHPPAATQLPSEWSALDASWHLIVRERGDDALYHLETDPSEHRNLVAAMPPDPGIDRLRAAIAAMRRSPKPDLRKFRSLGYVH